jgi:hypothetical protein
MRLPKACSAHGTAPISTLLECENKGSISYRLYVFIFRMHMRNAHVLPRSSLRTVEGEVERNRVQH